MRPKPANHAELRLAALAARQHGAVSLSQLLRSGLSRDAVKRRVRAGRLHRIHRGVYAVGHDGLSDVGRCMAAALALGDGAAVSHRSAAALWALLPFAAGFPHVTVPGDGGRRKRRGIHVHRSTTLAAGDCTRRLNIPVTTPTRTLLDLARIASPAEVARARRQAEFVGLALDASRLDGGEAPGSEAAALARSELERRFLRLCRRHRLPPPEVNAKVGRYEVDFLWRAERLIVETDGWAAHRGRAAFEHDRARATDLAAQDFEVLRFSWRQVQDDPGAVAAAVRARLRAGTTRASARPA